MKMICFVSYAHFLLSLSSLFLPFYFFSGETINNTEFVQQVIFVGGLRVLNVSDSDAVFYTSFL